MQQIRPLARLRVAALLLPALLVGTFTAAQDRMPKEDVIDVPAIGDGLCVHNLFQSNMVLQRDEPIRVWGWAAPGEEVTVTFATRRSDDWRMEEVPLGVLGDETVENGKLSRRQRARIRAVLRQEDLRRRLAEARMLLREHGESEGGPPKK